MFVFHCYNNEEKNRSTNRRNSWLKAAFAVPEVSSHEKDRGQQQGHFVKFTLNIWKIYPHWTLSLSLSLSYMSIIQHNMCSPWSCKIYIIIFLNIIWQLILFFLFWPFGDFYVQKISSSILHYLKSKPKYKPNYNVRQNQKCPPRTYFSFEALSLLHLILRRTKV